MKVTRGLFAMAPAVLAAMGCAKGHSAGAPGDDGGVTADSNADASCGDLCDADNDGVPDKTDKCSGTPAGSPVNKVGCADSQLIPTLQTMFPPYQLAWTSGGDLGRAGGLTWTYAGITKGDLFHIWWIICDDPNTPCGVSLASNMVAPAEGWAFDPTDSMLLAGKLVEINTTHIALADGSMPALTGRLTLTIVDGSPTPVPIPLATVANLGVPARSGLYGAEIKGAAYTVNAIIEVQASGTTTWTPYLDYYDSQPTPTTGGSTAVSFGGSFYDK